MTATAKGPFDVKMTPQGSATDPTAVGRMALDKTFHGDIQASSTGEMLAVRTAVTGSAGYVAIERVTGTLAGRTGTMTIDIQPGGKHFYAFTYTLPPAGK